ncbi:MAG: hypothetical protein NTX96_03080 [Candidatus Zambryskibacteria bacterium]|nr:hypothetical protein [Candidatus Zambryskibacteria bacterium]
METSQFIVPAFPSFLTSFLTNTPILLIILFLFFIIYTIVSIVLLYHWSEYGMRSGAILLAETVFILVSIVLFTTSFLALNYL